MADTVNGLTPSSSSSASPWSRWSRSPAPRTVLALRTRSEVLGEELQNGLSSERRRRPHVTAFGTRQEKARASRRAVRSLPGSGGEAAGLGRHPGSGRRLQARAVSRLQSPAHDQAAHGSCFSRISFISVGSARLRLAFRTSPISLFIALGFPFFMSITLQDRHRFRGENTDSHLKPYIKVIFTQTQTVSFFSVGQGRGLSSEARLGSRHRRRCSAF